MSIWVFLSVCVVTLPWYALLYIWSFWFFRQWHIGAGNKRQYLDGVLRKIDSVAALLETRVCKYNYDAAIDRMLAHPAVDAMLSILVPETMEINQPTVKKSNPRRTTSKLHDLACSGK